MVIMLGSYALACLIMSGIVFSMSPGAASMILYILCCPLLTAMIGYLTLVSIYATRTRQA